LFYYSYYHINGEIKIYIIRCGTIRPVPIKVLSRPYSVITLHTAHLRIAADCIQEQRSATAEIASVTIRSVTVEDQRPACTVKETLLFGQ